MELVDALKRRRMVRAFDSAPLTEGTIDGLIELARRAPSAGNTQATGFVVLEGAEVERYWSVTLAGSKRASFGWQKLLDAPAIVIITVEPERYLARYAEADKKATGLDRSLEAWPVPYWWVDAGAVAQNLLLLATDAGLGACLFGPFDNEAALCAALEVPDGVRLVASVAIGHPQPDAPGRSAGRERLPIDQITLRPADQ